jgi:DNA-binding response OmpR family regulator
MPRPRILLVEDNPDVRDVVRESLQDGGFEVDAAHTATEAFERLTVGQYAAILSDCVLPDLPPLEWLAVARSVAPVTPLVVYSGAVHLDELRELASDWGVAAVLAKPFSPSQLVAAVRAAVARLPDAEPGDT